MFLDLSKAFDSVNHIVLLQELGMASIPKLIFVWISDFLSGRSQAVKLGSYLSNFENITRSIVQGSGLGPMLYITLARGLKPISPSNRLFKYADDSTLLVPQNSDCSIVKEFDNVKQWSSSHKLLINNSKTKEIIFWKSKMAKNKHDVDLIDGIERVESVTLLGVIFNSELSWSSHINSMLSQISQRYYLISQLKQMSLDLKSLDQVFNAWVLSRLRYAIEAFSGNLLRPISIELMPSSVRVTDGD